MKKILLSGLASMLVLSACATNNQEITLPQVQENVSALAVAPSKEMKMDKEETKTVKKSEIALKDGRDLGTKPASNSIKKAETVKVSYKDVKASNYGEQAVAATANFALRSMDQAGSWESGANIGYRALEDLGRQGVYIAKLTYYAAKASTTWEDAYKMISLGLNNLAYQKPNTPANACDLVITMMDRAKSWESSSRAGFAAMEFIGQTDNYEVKRFLENVYYSAKSARTWEESHRIIINGVSELKRFF